MTDLVLNARLVRQIRLGCQREVRCWFLDLQPYCPDLNPTEVAFSKLKAHPGSSAARTFDQIFVALAESCNLFTSDECWNIFNEARYGSD